jgi:hypothetical protein
MDMYTPGDLVTLTDGGAELDGLVFDRPSSAKVVVAVVDPTRGPLFRAVDPSALSGREQEGPNDRVLRMLVRRTPPPHSAGRAATTGAQRRSGYTRGVAHRPTGR